MGGVETDFGLYLNVGTLLALIGSVATGVWKFAQIERSIRDAGVNGDQELREEMEAKVENVARDILRVERDSVGRAEIMRQETGEVGAALRTKIHEIEVYTRDNFVSNRSFDAVINRIEAVMDKLGDRLEAKIDRLSRG